MNFVDYSVLPRPARPAPPRTSALRTSWQRLQQWLAALASRGGDELERRTTPVPYY